MTHFVYPVRLSYDEDERVLVEFPDFPFAVTDGAEVAEALTHASDCLEEALAYYITDGEPIPEPSQVRRGSDDWIATVAPGPVIAAKAALYQAVRDAGLTKVALAACLGVDEKDVRRMLDPRYTTKIPALDRALTALGKRLEIEVRDVPTPPTTAPRTAA
jgi:antitoxin HicB